MTIRRTVEVGVYHNKTADDGVRHAIEVRWPDRMWKDWGSPGYGMVSVARGVNVGTLAIIITPAAVYQRGSTWTIAAVGDEDDRRRMQARLPDDVGELIDRLPMSIRSADYDPGTRSFTIDLPVAVGPELPVGGPGDEDGAPLPSAEYGTALGQFAAQHLETASLMKESISVARFRMDYEREAAAAQRRIASAVESIATSLKVLGDAQRQILANAKRTEPAAWTGTSSPWDRDEVPPGEMTTGGARADAAGDVDR